MRLRKDKTADQKLKNSSFSVNNFPFKLTDNTVMELAMGKGKMITTLASQNPNKFYLGVEKEATVILKALRRAQELNLNNFKVINQNINQLPNLFEGKITELWLTFPDPWPKNRHFKRRLIAVQYLMTYKKILNKNGVLKFKTDNEKLFIEALQNLIQNQWLITYQTNDLHNDIKNATNIMTDYEIKWQSQGKKIHYLEAEVMI